MSIEEIRQSASKGQLVVVLGAGASMALMPKSKKALSWTGLVKTGLEYGRDRTLITDEQFSRNLDALKSDDMDDLLSAAEFVGRKLQAPTGSAYARWMRNVFEAWSPEAGSMQNALRAINSHRIPISTLNYDTLAEVCTGSSPIDFADTDATLAWVRREREGVLHLHGVWTNPSGCVFGIRDYHSALTDDTRSFIQRSLSSLNRLLFVGCGDTFADPNFSTLIGWLRDKLGANVPQHYALVRNDELRKRYADPDWRGFVEPLGYGDDHAGLPAWLLNCFPTRSSSSAPVSRAKAAAGRDAHVITAYRTFLLRDCGEMTIEGMRADMETAQRRFDLEKLFVPLEVKPFPPILPLNDLDREAKLREWNNKNSKPLSFAEAFSRTKKIALLALPGGGKTLLLKRLAVAYAHPSRRESSDDNLPKLDLIPVLIRCREWKDHIRKPIPTLLRSMPSITGESILEGLLDALERPLKAGTVLLLVDGLDEIHDDGDRTIFVENLETFLSLYPKVRLVVTSREAGFDLVAPCLVRFCTKFSIAPLSQPAIIALCQHWHNLMSGGTPEANADAAAVSETLLKSDSLRRLAENPLLLTMLLVVKHGAGRLPPDRVSLYNRAVEVLLDTWNIKGHEALNVKEAVPQLACLAFELLKRGKQTATEREILEILEEARVRLPMVGRYAKDSPHDFLKRVELRSSLMLEGGHTSEDGKTVPFYQFRHLTFQEYLAAVAAVDGYTLSHEQGAPVLAALGDELISDEWKEVVPMAAVLSRMQAGPLLEALVSAAESEEKPYIVAKQEIVGFTTHLPPATGRLMQSMSEEAIFPPATLSRAVQIIARMASVLAADDNWQALSRGPYGPELRQAALDVYLNETYVKRSLARRTVALLEAHAEPASFWIDGANEDAIVSKLQETDTASLVKALLSIAGSFWIYREKSSLAQSQRALCAFEEVLFDERRSVHLAAAWCWGFWRHLQEKLNRKPALPIPGVLNRLVELFFAGYNDENNYIDYLIAEISGIKRGECSFVLTPRLKRLLRSDMRKIIEGTSTLTSDFKVAVVRIAFIVEGAATDREMRQLMSGGGFRPYEMERLQDISGALRQGTKQKRKPKVPQAGS